MSHMLSRPNPEEMYDLRVMYGYVEVCAHLVVLDLYLHSILSIFYSLKAQILSLFMGTLSKRSMRQQVDLSVRIEMS